MDAKALVAALAGTAIGAAVCYRLAKREWWAVSSVLAIGAAGLLGIVTEGNNSHVEHSVVFYVSVSLILWFAIAFLVHQRGSADGHVRGTSFQPPPGKPGKSRKGPGQSDQSAGREV